MENKKINFLLADDDEVDVIAVQRAFQRVGVEDPLIVASDGLEALDYLRGTGGKERVRKPYLVLLDLKMPRMSGIEFLRELRADPHHKDAVVFVLTSSRDDSQKMSAYSYNVAGYVVKSSVTDDFVRLAELLDRFRELIEFP